MLRGIETTKNGMMSILEYNDNIAHSLANSNTTAFKQTKLAFKNIHDNLINHIEKDGSIEKQSGTMGTLSVGSVIDSYTIDFSQGPIKETGNTFDLAINGEGFFKIQDKDNQPSYTRNGTLIMQTDGTMTDMNNRPILSRSGVVKIPLQDSNGKSIDTSKIVIQADGSIFYDKVNYGKIDIYDFDDKSKLVDIGNGSFRLTNNADNDEKIITNTRIEQGSLELSNANPILSLINSINAQRSYETMNNIMQSTSKSLENAINKVGKSVG
ncbi:MAG: flagellar hook-basal body complex protein [Candidatus Gastranaerophilales bacterium]|nr:flagellar hook-basal body complex protein [Candidatus Gastranaerophilales bacterium]